MPETSTAKPVERARHEIEHGRLLAERDPELIWGWATPAVWTTPGGDRDNAGQ